MKKGSKVKITKNAQYPGQTMSWTETFTGEKTIGNGGEWVFHQSDRKINAFRSKVICVHSFEHGKSYLESTTKNSVIRSRYNWKKYIYAIFLPEGTIVDTYSDDEYRFQLDTDMDVIYAGIVYEAKDGQKQGKDGKMVDSYIQYSDTIKIN